MMTPAARAARGIRPWLLAALVGGAAVPVMAAPATAVANPTDARGWLARIQSASATANFSGTFVVTTGGVASSSRIVHAWDGRQAFEMVESLDGPPHQVLRRDDLVKTVWPKTRSVLVERRQHDSSFPFLLRAAGARLADLYDWSTAGVERVAGHDAVVLLVRPRDEFRLSHRLWSEARTGLLLRADVLGPSGEVLESAAFSQVTLGAKPPTAEVLQALARADSFQVLQSPYAVTDLRREGWSLDSGVPGFLPVSCVRRPVPPPPGRLTAAEGPARSLVQAVYSDGLVSVSVFIEPTDRGATMPTARTTNGALSTLTQWRDGWRITVIGDVPAATLDRFAAGLRRTGS
jgi:sigma-E factor negative regulatory protein RseB